VPGSPLTAMLKIRAPGCLIANLCINGASSTGGGILLDDDYIAKAAYGTSIVGCFLRIVKHMQLMEQLEEQLCGQQRVCVGKL